jgi:SAM-dependent methyltransferase
MTVRRKAAQELKSLPIQEVVLYYQRMFPWLRKHRELVNQAVLFGQTCEPAVDHYYWNHLPRLVHTVALFKQQVPRLRGTQPLCVLDAGSFPALAGYFRLMTADIADGLEWVHTMLTPSSVAIRSALGDVSIECVGQNLHDNDLPYPDATFDAVILAEVIEHLSIHPQMVFKQMRRVLKSGGVLLVTTPNVTSWKKIRSAIDGSWSYDSPTYSGEWGHRYEFSCYQVRHSLMNAGFYLVHEETRDVNPDDPRGFRSALEFAGLVLLRLLVGQWRSAAKLVLRRGSGMFMVAEKSGQLSDETVVI